MSIYPIDGNMIMKCCSSLVISVTLTNYLIMPSSSILVLLLLWLVSASAASDLVALLTDPSNDWSPTTFISLPNETTFHNVTERWTTFSAPTYLAAISPGTEDDLIKVVGGPLLMRMRQFLIRLR